MADRLIIILQKLIIIVLIKQIPLQKGFKKPFFHIFRSYKFWGSARKPWQKTG